MTQVKALKNPPLDAYSTYAVHLYIVTYHLVYIYIYVSTLRRCLLVTTIYQLESKDHRLPVAFRAFLEHGHASVVPRDGDARHEAAPEGRTGGAAQGPAAERQERHRALEPERQQASLRHL